MKMIWMTQMMKMTDKEIESQMRKLSRDLTNQCSFTECKDCIAFIHNPDIPTIECLSSIISDILVERYKREYDRSL